MLESAAADAGTPLLAAADGSVCLSSPAATAEAAADEVIADTPAGPAWAPAGYSLTAAVPEARRATLPGRDKATAATTPRSEAAAERSLGGSITDGASTIAPAGLACRASSPPSSVYSTGLASSGSAAPLPPNHPPAAVPPATIAAATVPAAAVLSAALPRVAVPGVAVSVAAFPVVAALSGVSEDVIIAAKFERDGYGVDLSHAVDWGVRPPECSVSVADSHCGVCTPLAACPRLDLSFSVAPLTAASPPGSPQKVSPDRSRALPGLLDCDASFASLPTPSPSLVSPSSAAVEHSAGSVASSRTADVAGGEEVGKAPPQAQQQPGQGPDNFSYAAAFAEGGTAAANFSSPVFLASSSSVAASITARTALVNDQSDISSHAADIPATLPPSAGPAAAEATVLSLSSTQQQQPPPSEQWQPLRFAGVTVFPAGGGVGGEAMLRVALLAKLVTAVFSGLLLILAVTHLNIIGSTIKQLLEDIRALGNLSPVAFFFAYTLLVMIFVPAEALNVAAGFIFVNLYGYAAGLAVATATCTAALLTASVACVSLSRYVFSAGMQRLFRHNDLYHAFQLAVEEGGTCFVALIRLSPVLPFAATCYLFGLTPITMQQLVVGSLSSIVLVFFFNCMGAALQDMNDVNISHFHWTWKQSLLGVFGLLMALISVGYIGELTRRKLAEASEAAARRRLQQQILLNDAEAGEDIPSETTQNSLVP